MSVQSVVIALLRWGAGVGLAGALVRELLRWRLDLYVHVARKSAPRTSLPRTRSEYSYTVAVHNAEDADLAAPWALVLAIEDDTSDFNGAPHVYTGRTGDVSALRMEKRRDSRDEDSVVLDPRGPGRSVAVLEAEGMGRKETWFVRFGTDASPGNVAVRVISREARRSKSTALPLVKEMELKPSYLGDLAMGSGTNRRWAQWWVGLLSAWLYLIPIVSRDTPLLAGRGLFGPLQMADIGTAGMLCVLSVVMMRVSQRKHAPFIQGYGTCRTPELLGTPTASRYRRHVE